MSLNEWAVLGLVVESPRHGYDIAAELRAGVQVGEVWSVPRQAVYRALERLTDLGHVEPRRTEAGEAAPRRTVFGSTRRGRRALTRWLDTPVVHLREVRSSLLLKLVLAERLGHDTATLLQSQREHFAPLLEAREASSPSSDPVELWRHHAARAVDSFLEALGDPG